MKIVNKIILVLTVVAMMSSCTQRRYGHITGFQLKKNTPIEKVTERKGHYVSPVEQIAEVASDDVIPSITNEKVITPEVKNTTIRTISSPSSTLLNQSRFATEWEETMANPVIAKTTNTLKPQNIVKKVKSKVGKKTKAGGLIYWILVVILVILIVSLLNKVLGTTLTGIIITVVLIAFVGHLLGLW